jgi:signal peptidase II
MEEHLQLVAKGGRPTYNRSSMHHRLWFLATALAACALDLWTKGAAFASNPDGLDVAIIEGFFYMGKTTNRGIVFGIAPDAGPIFKIISVLAVPAIVFIFLSVKKPRWVLTASLALILGGTLGNMYDRLRYDEVRDFIKFYYGASNPWPLFNIADSCICVGVFLLTLEMLFFDEKKAKAEDPAFSTERIAVGETEPMPRADAPPPPPPPPADPEHPHEPDPQSPSAPA